jgi:energy-coupling factor transporter ATP-binding protein EcfA2
VRERIGVVLGRVGMSDHLKKRIDQLSGGERQRVAIARALVNRPHIILADEPTAALDRDSGRDVVNLIQELAREEGASVVLVTHDSRILDVADRILHLEDGRLKSLQEAVATEATRMLHLLAEHEPAGHRTLIGFAIALARVANADRHLAREEVELIRRVLSEVAELAPGEVEFVVAVAIESVRTDSTMMATTFQRMTSTEKERLVRALHAVAEADGEFTEAERGEIDRIVSELGP